MKKTILTLAMLTSLTAFAQPIVNLGEEYYKRNGNTPGANKETYILLEHNLKDVERRTYWSGVELQTYIKHKNLGLGFSLGGSALLYSGVSLSLSRNIPGSSYYRGDKGPAVIVTGMGAVLSLVGMYYAFEAPVHIRRAALILSGNGVGIQIRL
jgi:hypothetical protein